jgi:phosphoglycolate phosphatase
LQLTHKKHIIFDLDGTLIDSGPDLAEAVNVMLESLGRERFSLETIHEWVGNGAQTLVKRALLGRAEVDEEINGELFENALETFLSYYEQNVCVKTVTYPHVIAALQALRQKGYKLSIVTNKPYKFIQPILESFEIEELFDLYLGGDSLPQKKPDPTPLLHICKELSVSVEESIMVGDSKNDILAAGACGMESIGVSYGYNYGEDISLYNPTLVVNQFDKILEVVE